MDSDYLHLLNSHIFQTLTYSLCVFSEKATTPDETNDGGSDKESSNRNHSDPCYFYRCWTVRSFTFEFVLGIISARTPASNARNPAKYQAIA